MAITIDYTNLRIVLESGVSLYDVEKDLYSRWKDDYKTNDNSKNIVAFESEGGDPVNATLDQGAYIRMRNDLGWRIRPAEENGTVSFIGNLLAQDDTLPLTVPTIGAFTVLINGLQPITQNVDKIAGKVWDETSADHLTAGSLGQLMRTVYGLGGSNQTWTLITRDSNGNMLSARLTAYTDNTKQVVLKKWDVTATYDGNNNMVTYELLDV